MAAIDIVDVTAANVERADLFCAMSRSELPGVEEKRAWAKKRFAEGLRIKLIRSGGRGFIEYIPAEYAWRGVDAPGYMLIHCLAVGGRSQRKGCGSALLAACIADARAAGKLGVAAVTARDRSGLVDTGFYEYHGFHLVESVPPGIDLVALKFSACPNPKLLSGWKAKRAAFGKGLTVVSSPQCPFACEGAQQIVQLARDARIPVRSVRLKTLDQLRERAPSPYASFDLVYDGEVVANLSRTMSAARLRKLIAQAHPRPA